MLIDHLQIPEELFITVKDEEVLSLGDKTLKFIYSPWVHWPETMVTYLEEGIMKARNCCQTMEMELTSWKAIIYVILRRMEKLSGADKAKFLPNIEDIHILVEEMDERIEEIRDKCTPETGIDDIRTEKEEFDKTMAVARVKVEDAIEYLGAGNFGG